MENKKYYIIPAPLFTETGDKTFPFFNYCIDNDPKFSESVSLLKVSLKVFHDIEPGQQVPDVKIIMKFRESEEEEYWISIVPNQIHIQAGGVRGIVRGIASLLQMIEENQNGKFIRHGEVHDKPRFAYRGYMLDVSRHFFSIDSIKKILDLLFLYKINIFHWHLTDDQGWRFESKTFPRLTAIGSERGGTQYFNHYDPKPHGGYYSQKDIRMIVEYGKERGIEIVPEIDFPGHFTAALAAYPELSCHEEKVDVAQSYGILKNVACMGNRMTLPFIKSILDEVCELFPSSMIHLGGDEVPLNSWKSCQRCLELMRNESMTHPRELQSYGSRQLIEYLESKGKRVILWNEAFIKKTIDSSAICQHWFDPPFRKNSLKEINSGRQTIVSDLSAYYLDYPYFMISLKKTYHFNPIFKGIKNRESIIGVESALWTEEVSNEERLVEQTLPRLVAMAERGWADDDNCVFTDFSTAYLRQEMLRAKIGYLPLKNDSKRLRGFSLIIARLGFIWKLISIEIKQKILYS